MIGLKFPLLHFVEFQSTILFSIVLSFHTHTLFFFRETHSHLNDITNSIFFHFFFYFLNKTLNKNKKNGNRSISVHQRNLIFFFKIRKPFSFLLEFITYPFLQRTWSYWHWHISFNKYIGGWLPAGSESFKRCWWV